MRQLDQRFVERPSACADVAIVTAPSGLRTRSLITFRSAAPAKFGHDAERDQHSSSGGGVISLNTA
jgi:hypothetical protein